MTIRRFNLEDVGGLSLAVVESPSGGLMDAADVTREINKLTTLLALAEMYIRLHVPQNGFGTETGREGTSFDIRDELLAQMSAAIKRNEGK